MRRALVAAVALLLLSAQAAVGLEEGHHLHFGITNLPIDTVAISRVNTTLHLVLQAHRQEGSSGSAWIRVADYSTVKPTIVAGKRASQHTIALSGLLSGPVALDLTIPFAEWSCGRHELRFTINLGDNFEGNRQFTTSRAFILLQGCTTDRSGRPSSWHGGGGGWYEGVDYAIAIAQSPFSAFVSGGSTQWRVQSSANRGCLFLNPNAHAGSMGTQIGSCWSGTSTVTRVLPALVAGDRVVAYAEDSPNHAGLYAVWVGSGTTRHVEWQDWWDSSGLDVP